MKKNIPFFLLFVLACFHSYGQSLDAEKQKKRLPGGTYDGFFIELNGELEVIRNAWTGNLKELGKFRRKRRHYVVKEAVLQQFNNITLLTEIKMNRDSLVSVWLGYDAGAWSRDESNWSDDKIAALDNAVKVYLLAFGQDHYRNRLQHEITETEQAANYISRKHQRLLQERKSLEIKLEELELEKNRLEEAINKITLEYKSTQQRIENNKQDADKALEDLEKINKVLESHKEKLKDLN